MIGITVMATITTVFAIVQISIFRALPRCIRKYLAYWPIFAVLVNFGGSFLILTFTGTTNFMGPINLMSSVIFALYIFMYKKHRAIHFIKRGRLKFPGLVEGNINPSPMF